MSSFQAPDIVFGVDFVQLEQALARAVGMVREASVQMNNAARVNFGPGGGGGGGNVGGGGTGTSFAAAGAGAGPGATAAGSGSGAAAASPAGAGATYNYVAGGAAAAGAAPAFNREQWVRDAVASFKSGQIDQGEFARRIDVQGINAAERQFNRAQADQAGIAQMRLHYRLQMDRAAGTQEFRSQQQDRERLEASVGGGIRERAFQHADDYARDQRAREQEQQARGAGIRERAFQHAEDYARDQAARAAANRRQVAGENRQERDTDWYVRDQIRAQTQANRAQVSGENRQERDESWYVRDQQRAQTVANRAQVAAENRQNRDEGGYERDEIRQQMRADRYEEQTRRAGLRRRVAETRTHAGRARVYEAEADANFAEGTPEHENLMAQAASERSQSFTRLPRGREWNRIMMQAFFGAHEVSGALNARTAMETQLSLTSDPAKRLQIEAQGIQQMYSGFIGGTIGLVADAFGKGPSQLIQQNTVEAARIEAHREQKIAVATRDQAREIAAIPNVGFGALDRARVQAQQQGAVRNTALQLEIGDIQAQLGGTHTEKKVTRTFFGLNQTEDVTVPDVQGGARETMKTRLATLNTEIQTNTIQTQDALLDVARKRVEYTNTMRGLTTKNLMATTSDPMKRLAMEHQQEYADALQSTGSILGVLDPNPEVRNYFQSILQRQTQERTTTTLQQDAIKNYTREMSAASKLANSDRPVSAALAENEARRNLALSKQPHDATGRIINTPETNQIVQQSIDTAEEIRANFRRQSELTGIGLKGQGEALTVALGARNAATGSQQAQSIMERTRTEVQAKQLMNQEDFGNAATTLKNGILAQKLQKQEYLDSFRATQFDLANNVISPRDTESPGEVLGTINAAVKSLDDKLGQISVTL